VHKRNIARPGILKEIPECLNVVQTSQKVLIENENVFQVNATKTFCVLSMQIFEWFGRQIKYLAENTIIFHEICCSYMLTPYTIKSVSSNEISFEDTWGGGM
jgi:hypothetical protein